MTTFFFFLPFIKTQFKNKQTKTKKGTVKSAFKKVNKSFLPLNE